MEASTLSQLVSLNSVVIPHCGYHRVLIYVFFSLPHQRLKGALFGDVRVFDDIHGVSSSGYHLAACTVQTNDGCEAVAFGLLATSNNENWQLFVSDCSEAFKCEENERPWHVCISDGAQEIKNAVRQVNPSVLHWTCWYHWKKILMTTYNHEVVSWEPLIEVLHQLLYCSELSIIEKLKKKAETMVKGMKSGSPLSKKCRKFLDEVMGRILCELHVFSNGWTSSSVGEETNSVLSCLEIRAQVPLLNVLDRVIRYAELKQHHERQTLRALSSVESPFLGPLEGVLSREGMQVVLNQWSELAVLRREKKESVWKVSTIDRRKVYFINEDMMCTCNMRTWRGIICSHVIAVHVELGKQIPITMVDTRWYKEQLTPTLTASSPFHETVDKPTPIPAARLTIHIPALSVVPSDETVFPKFSFDTFDLEHSQVQLNGIKSTNLHLQETRRTSGPPRRLRIKTPSVKPRCNGKRSKAQYHCSMCGSTKHNKARCRKTPQAE